MSGVSLFTADGLYIGEASHIAASQSCTGAAPPGESSSDSADLLLAASDLSDVPSASRTVTPTAVTQDEGAHLISLYRLFLQLHRPLRSHDGGDDGSGSGAGEAGAAPSGAGSGGHKRHSVDDGTSWGGGAGHQTAYPLFLSATTTTAASTATSTAETSGYNSPQRVSSELYLNDSGAMDAHEPDASGCYHHSYSERDSNRNRAASGADELPIHCGLAGQSTPAAVQLAVETSSRSLCCSPHQLPPVSESIGGKQGSSEQYYHRHPPRYVFCCFTNSTSNPSASQTALPSPS